LSSKENELEKVNELLGNTQKEKDELERKQANYEEQRANLQCTMEQQVSSLRFQLSSEALKYDEEIKVGFFAIIMVPYL
jgi:molecular chaperone GrpE (heat shock protein)